MRSTATTPPTRSTNRPAAGFTLVEMLVVIVVLVILVGLLVPALSGARKAAKKAATQANMQGFIQACGAYRADKQRAPGEFNPSQLGSAQNDPRNNGGYGLSAMQNAILSLAGGVVARGAAVDAAIPTVHQQTVTFLTGVGINGTGAYDKILIEPRLVGRADGPQYLNMSPDVFIASAGRINAKKRFRPELEVTQSETPPPSNPRIATIPEMIDGEGMPVLMWQADALALPEDNFAAMKSNLSANIPQRAKFYWNSNAGLLCSNFLGRRGLNQSGKSTLGKSAGGGPMPGPAQQQESSDDNIISSMTALLGNPSFSSIRTIPGPTNNSPGTNVKVPTQAIGDIVLHSAGNDGIYLAKVAAIVKASYDDTPAGLGNTAQTIDAFDDYTVSGN